MAYHAAHVHWPVDYPGPWAGVWLESIGHRDVSRQTAIVDPHFYCVHIVTRGHVHHTAAPGVDERVGPDDLFALWPGSTFAFHADPLDRGADVRLEWIRLRGPMAGAYMESMGLSVERPCRRARRPQRVRALMRELLKLADAYPPDADMRAVSLLHELPPACAYEPTRVPPDRPLAVRAREIMENYVEQGMNVTQLCEVLGVSRTTLFLKFKEQFDRSPVEVLVDVRVAHAKRLLEHTDLPIARVASACGYVDPLYFARQFRQRVGMTPSGYRRGKT